jgi:protein TonB
VEASVVCSNYGKVMGDAAFPREAMRAGLEEGSALMQFTLAPSGEVKDVKALQATHPSFARGAARIVSEYRCAGQGRDVIVTVPFTFRSN